MCDEATASPTSSNRLVFNLRQISINIDVSAGVWECQFPPSLTRSPNDASRTQYWWGLVFLRVVPRKLLKQNQAALEDTVNHIQVELVLEFLRSYCRHHKGMYNHFLSILKN